MLDTSTRAAAAARSGLIDLRFAFVVDHADVSHQRAHVRSRKEADLACLGWIKRVEQLYTDAALVLDASTRAAAAARSGLIDLRVASVIDHADVSHQRAHVRSRKEADLASLGWI